LLSFSDKGLIKMNCLSNTKQIKPSASLRLGLILFLSLVLTSIFSQAQAAETYPNLSLARAIDIALKNNVEKQISYQSALIAESQYQQALSARWPSLTLQAGFQHKDQAPTFIFPATSMPLPQSLTAPLSQMGISARNIDVPEQNIKIMNQNISTASLQFLYPLYTGGKITSIINQASIGKEIAQEEYRRTSLQIVRDVKRYYFASQLTRELSNTAKEIVSMLNSTRDFTKSLYEGGSETVNKLDFLKTELAVSYAKSVEIDFSSKHQSALAALANTMGLSWDSQISIEAPLDNKADQNPQLQTLVEQAHQFNPQVGILRLAVRAANEKIDEAQSSYLPQIALTADTTHYENSYDKGLASSSNKDSWTIGVGISMPLFNGGLSAHQVNTAKLQSAQMQDKQKLVEQGVATLVKNLLIEYASANQQISISEQAATQAQENVDLTSRALQIGASKPQDMIEASILEGIVKGNLLRAKHDQQLNLAEINYLLGAEAQ
jgi:outer membrane protein TolC